MISYPQENGNLKKGYDGMKCPCCGNEMESGIVQSGRKIFFTTKEQKNWLAPDIPLRDEIVVSSHNWTRPTCAAYHCPACKKVVMDYGAEVE